MAPTVGEMVFVDTNVLVSATDESRLQHREAYGLIAESGPRGLHLAASGQILREYLVVATRPTEVNGLGLTVVDATANLHQFLRHIHTYEETEAVAKRLRDLGISLGLRGKRFHDANIVATMVAHGIHTLVTDNGDDFTAFDEIETVTVSGLAAALHAPGGRAESDPKAE
ncbi:MAG: type II toxin-antitoxin system VapC family toxin [Chloroflexota bacterium]|nr:type II toxin-antitoxin system VapC family toxin [Chloroflexota bacterium]